MYIIAVLAEKGGVAKTTIALDLAVTASREGYKVAVIDVDHRRAHRNGRTAAAMNSRGQFPQSGRRSIAAIHVYNTSAELEPTEAARESQVR